MVVGVDHRLVVHSRVDGGDGHLLQTQLAVEQMQHRHAGVGGAGGIGDQPRVRIQAVVVDAVDQGGIHRLGVGHRLGEQHTGYTGFDEAGTLVTAGVLPGAFQQQVDIQRRPVHRFGGGRTEHLHAVAIDVQTVAVDPNLTGKAPVGGVEAGQVLDAGLIGQIVEGHYLHVLPAPLMQGAQHAAAYTAVAVQDDAIGPAARHVHSSSSSSSATARILSRVKPKASNSSPAGADSP